MDTLFLIFAAICINNILLWRFSYGQNSQVPVTNEIFKLPNELLYTKETSNLSVTIRPFIE